MNNLVLRALFNPVRLKLLTCLNTKKATVTDLISNCNLSQSAVSQHLTVLKEAGIVETQKQGRFVFYSLKSKKAAEVADIVLDLAKDK